LCYQEDSKSSSIKDDSGDHEEVVGTIQNAFESDGSPKKELLAISKIKNWRNATRNYYPKPSPLI